MHKTREFCSQPAAAESGRGRKAPARDGGVADIGVDRITHARASVGDCGPLWPRPPWSRLPRAERCSASDRRFSFRVLLFCVSRQRMFHEERGRMGRPSAMGWLDRGGRWTGPTPLRAGNPCQKYLGPKIPRGPRICCCFARKSSQTIPFSRRRSLWQG